MPPIRKDIFQYLITKILIYIAQYLCLQKIYFILINKVHGIIRNNFYFKYSSKENNTELRQFLIVLKFSIRVLRLKLYNIVFM